MNTLEKVRHIAEVLKSAGIDDPVREAELLLSHCLGIDRISIYRDNPPLSHDALSALDRYVQRRAGREPIQYILGYVDFCGLRINVGSGVLIPRPETELLLEEAIKSVKTAKPGNNREPNRYLSPTPSIRILDVCTGSGCIALALAREFPEALVYGTDISGTAIKYAEANAKVNGITNATFLKGNLFEPVEQQHPIKQAPFKFSLIISNPPYIRSDEIKTLQPEIQNWEPAEALDGGDNGIDYYHAIISVAPKYMEKQGCLLLELGMGQAGEVISIAKAAGFRDISVTKDFSGIERILKAAFC
jgi:release factor glutamine methyltransferase